MWRLRYGLAERYRNLDTLLQASAARPARDPARISSCCTIAVGKPCGPAGQAASPAALSTASGSGPACRDPGGPWAITQGGADPNPAEAQLQELIQKANALRAKGAYGEAAMLWQQILAIVEKAMGPEHPDTAQSFNNLALLYLAQTNALAAERCRSEAGKDLGIEPSLNPVFCIWKLEGDIFEACR
jgi:hypothetical protein